MVPQGKRIKSRARRYEGTKGMSLQRGLDAGADRGPVSEVLGRMCWRSKGEGLYMLCEHYKLDCKWEGLWRLLEASYKENQGGNWNVVTEAAHHLSAWLQRPRTIIRHLHLCFCIHLLSLHFDLWSVRPRAISVSAIFTVSNGVAQIVDQTPWPLPIHTASNNATEWELRMFNPLQWDIVGFVPLGM